METIKLTAIEDTERGDVIFIGKSLEYGFPSHNTAMSDGVALDSAKKGEKFNAVVVERKKECFGLGSIIVTFVITMIFASLIINA